MVLLVVVGVVVLGAGVVSNAVNVLSPLVFVLVLEFVFLAVPLSPGASKAAKLPKSSLPAVVLAAEVKVMVLVLVVTGVAVSKLASNDPK